MIPRSTLRKLGSFAFLSGVVLLFGVLASSSFAGDGSASVVAAGDFMPGSHGASSRPPATFFSINAVLAKLDRQRGRGPEAIRFAALTPSRVTTDAQVPEKELPELGKEPFGLFTFRAPEGMLWRKWRGLGQRANPPRAMPGNSGDLPCSCGAVSAADRGRQIKVRPRAA